MKKKTKDDISAIIWIFDTLSNNIMTRVLVKMFEAEKGINEIMGKNERR